MDELAGRRSVPSRAELVDQLDVATRQIEAMNRVITNMSTQHITWGDGEGNTYHPDWCRECRVSVLLALLWKVMTEKSGDLSRRADDRT